MNDTGRWDVLGLRVWLRERIADVVETAVSEIGEETPLQEYGMSSRDAVMIAGELEDLLDVEVPVTLLWEHPSVDEIARHLLGAADPEGERSPARGDDGGRGADSGALAVVGLGCRFPGAEGPEQFWDLLRAGRDAIGRVPEGRWEQFTSGSDTDEAVLDRTPHHGGFLADVAGFDAEFFGITPREAALMDPQQRMLLEVTREAFEHAGIPAEDLRGTATGVFVGVSTQDYALLTMSDLGGVDAWSSTGVSPSITGNRLSYTFDLRGPSMTLDTACSSSLVAVHQACQSLRSGEIDTALVGGVNLLLSPATMINFELGGALAADGRCKAFDAAADGIARGEGCGVVVLKRLDDAHHDGDRVLAVLRGSAVNSDGRSNGLTAPNPGAQQDLLRSAYHSAATPPGEVDYVEAHGTGTRLGDPMEASALSTVLGEGRARERPLLLGSVKTNLGHLESAAGIAGLIKVVLAMVHGEVPPSLHYHDPNPHVSFDDAGLRVITEPTPWPRYGDVARAGVSGFGFGGTNAHVVLEEYVAHEPGTARRGRTNGSAGSEPREHGSADVAVLSGYSQPRLRETADRLADWLESPEGRLAGTRSVAATLARRRSHHTHRAAVVAADNHELTAGLRAVASGSTTPEVCTGSARTEGTGPVWVFSGYGSQWPGMGAGLLAGEPAFAERIDELDVVFLEHAGFSLRKTLESEEPIDDLEREQLAIFGVQLGLAALWRSLGVEPAAVLGHSMGEVAAAVTAGAIGAEDGVRVMANRARLLAGLNDRGGGAMAAVELSVDELTALRETYPEVGVAVYGAPDQLTLAGDAEQLRAVVDHVHSLDRTARLLPVRGAGHSGAVDPVLGELRAELADVRATTASVPHYTSVLDDPRDPALCDADYWAANARRPVRFSQAVAAALEDGYTTFLEIAPHPIASGAVVRTANHQGAETPLVATGPRRGHDESWAVRANLGRLYCAGAAIRWESVHPGHEIVDLPRTRWQHQRHWARSARSPKEAIGGYTAVRAVPEESREEPSETEGAGPETAGVRGERIRNAEPAAAHALLADHVRAVIAEIMGFPPEKLESGTPLTELGLDSLMTMRIKNTVEHDLGVSGVTPTALRGAALDDVISHLAGLLELGPVREGESVAPDRETAPAELTDPARGDGTAAAERPNDGPLRVLRGHGSHTPLFVFHAAGGDSDVYRPLVDALDGRVPVYGFDRIDNPDLPGRVATYLERLRAVQPHGPYRLAGWSFGGALAYQAACELIAAGETVELLALIDTVLPLPDPHDDPRVTTAHRFLRFGRFAAQNYGCDLGLRLDELTELSSEQQIELVMARAVDAGLGSSPGALRHQRDSFVDTLAAERHHPAPYRSPMVLYRAEQPDTAGATLEPRYNRADPAGGWDEFCDRLEVVPVAGDHLSVIDPPYVRAIAEHLGRMLTGQAGDPTPADDPER